MIARRRWYFPAPSNAEGAEVVAGSWTFDCRGLAVRAPRGGGDRPAHDRPQIPDSPAAFLESWQCYSRQAPARCAGKWQRLNKSSSHAPTTVC